MLCGCTSSLGASAGKIIPPSNDVYPLLGKWTVTQDLGNIDTTGDLVQQWVGSSVQFDKDTVAFSEHVWNNLSYKIKKVKAGDYLMTKYIPPSSITIKDNQEVDVITVYADTNFLCELMKIDDNRMIFFAQNQELLLKKVSNQADRKLGVKDKNSHDLNQYNKEGKSGVLLGLKIPSKEGYTYQTLWIAVDHQELRPVLTSQQLFFPRTSGFWELKVEDNSGKAGNLLLASNVGARALEMKKETEETDEKVNADSSERIIHYIGNDYVSIEKNTAGLKQLQVLPVDKLSSSTEIKVSDLLGVKGSDAYLTARNQAIAALKAKGITSINKDELEENFGLTRKNGHWFLVGRVNYQKGQDFGQSDFNLKVIPPANLIFYDTLALSWYHIKDRVPDAIDAFTSPNKDIALVKTKNKLMIYTIFDEQLAKNPLAEIAFQEGESIIMAEWAMEPYVDSWEKSYLSYGAQTLSSSFIRRHQGY